MSALQEIEWEESLLEPRRDKAIEREIRKAGGFVLPFVSFFQPCPWLARSLGKTYRSRQLVHTELALADLIFLVVSQDNSCRFCYGSQRSLLRIQGFDEERIRRLEDLSFTAEDDPRERLALDFARRVSRANPPPSAAEKDDLREAGYSEESIKEIAYVAAFTVLATRITTLPAVPLVQAEGFDKRWFVKLFRPLIARYLRSQSKQGQPEFLPPELKTGPFSYLTNELDGLPIAGTFREVLDSAWSSPILTQRAKALVFAVVARGLDSKRSEREATSLLTQHGVDEAQVQEVLSHLASPVLDPIEAAIVPFARETIRPRPVDIQRRGRKLREQLTLEQFVELIGVVGIANAICRLSLTLCEG